jgi:hypothetical protein
MFEEPMITEKRKKHIKILINSKIYMVIIIFTIIRINKKIRI